MKRIFYIGLLLFLLISCKKEIQVSHRYEATEAFDRIILSSDFNVFLKEGNSFKVEIVGDENHIDKVELSIADSVITIRNTKKLRAASPTKNKIDLYITSPPLREITAAEGCNIQTIDPVTSAEFGLILTGKSNEASLELNGGIFYYWNNFPSGGKLTLSGTTETVKIWNDAIMSVDAKNLIARNAIVENGSKGDCEVRVLERLQYQIDGPGNIHLYGNPVEIQNTGTGSGAGKLIRH